MFTLRSATAADFPAIRKLIWQVGINPIGLDWRRFVLAVDEEGRLLGCGQIKPHREALENWHRLPSFQRHAAWGLPGRSSPT